MDTGMFTVQYNTQDSIPPVTNFRVGFHRTMGGTRGTHTQTRILAKKPSDASINSINRPNVCYDRVSTFFGENVSVWRGRLNPILHSDGKVMTRLHAHVGQITI